MGFQFIVRKTLIDLSGYKRMLMLIIVGTLVPALVALGWRSTLEMSGFSLEMQTYYVISNFLTISFIWVAGFFMAFMVSANAAGLISKEATEETLLPLVSKPISRRQIVLGKFCALVVNAVLLEAIILVLLVLVFRFVLSIEISIFLSLLSTIPWILLYSLLVIIVFGALSLAFSTLIESQIGIMVMVIAVIVFILGFGTLSHAMGLHTILYQQYHLYFVDGSYQFGNVFVPAMTQATGGDLLPISQLRSFQTITGVFAGGREAGDMAWGYSSSGWFSRSGQLAYYVSPAVSVIILLAIFSVALGVALWGMERKEVH